MIDMALWIALALFCAAVVLNFYRAVVGPSLPDRILAVDTMYMNSIALIVLFGIWVDNKDYFEAAEDAADQTFDSDRRRGTGLEEKRLERGLGASAPSV